jgi:hypothetical protein
MVCGAFTPSVNEKLSGLWHGLFMSAIPHAAKALTSAFDRLELAATRMLGAVNGASGGAEATLTDMTMAKHQLKAMVQVTRVADSMLAELLKLQAERD